VLTAAVSQENWLILQDELVFAPETYQAIGWMRLRLWGDPVRTGMDLWSFQMKCLQGKKNTLALGNLLELRFHLWYT
jgi:hypothetical protein